jgi:hypothetical protein
MYMYTSFAFVTFSKMLFVGGGVTQCANVIKEEGIGGESLSPRYITPSANIHLEEFTSLPWL